MKHFRNASGAQYTRNILNNLGEITRVNNDETYGIKFNIITQSN